MNKVPKEFNWKYYLSLNPDILQSGIANQAKATAHYLKHGIAEGRKYKSVPSDFNWKLYLYMNQDVQPHTEESAKNHYDLYGESEGRKYKTSNVIPTGFNWEEYISINSDLKEAGIVDEESARYHFLVYGIYEKRRYKHDQILPTDFDWKEYIACNLDISEGGITTKELAIDHYLKHGILEGRKYIKFKYKQEDHKNKKEIYIVCENNNGGSWKYLVDIMDNYKNYNYIFLNTKESITNIKKGSLIIVQYLFNIEFSIHTLLSLISTLNLKLIIPIHDFYWFDINTKNQHNKYLITNAVNDTSVIKLFNLAYKVICPSDFVHKEYSKYFNTSNFITVPHNDYSVTNELIIPKVKTIINIGIFNDYSIYKGKEAYEYITNNVVQYKGYFPKYLIVGKNIPRYNESDFYEYVSRYNIHAFLLLNKWGETYCYTLTKILNSGLPIFYNNIGAFKERIPTSDHYFVNSNSESDYSDTVLLKERFCKFLDYLIANNRNDSYKQILSNKIHYVPFYNNLLHNYKDIVIITSKIIVSNNKLNYAGNRSIYTPIERYNDTLKTIQSIKKYIPEAYIILVDNSELNTQQSIVLNRELGHFLNINNKEYSYYTDKSEYKGFGEIYQTILGLKYIQDNNIQYESLFKISGRYILNNSFDINNYRTEGFIFKKNTTLSDRKYYYTCFYKIGNIQEYIQILKRILKITNFDKYNNFKDLEVIVPHELNENKIKFNTIPLLGLTQNVSVWDDKSNI